MCGVPKGAYVVAVKYLPDGSFLATQGASMVVLDEEDEVLRDYPLEGSGWSHIEHCSDGEHAFLGNIWLGIVIKLELDSREIVATLDIGLFHTWAGYRSRDTALNSVLTLLAVQHARKAAGIDHAFALSE